MTISEHDSNGSVGTTDTDTKRVDAGDGNQQRFTGVVLIHGLGLIPRNGMLQQSLNSLTYWFNHDAGLAMRPEGRGRIWLVPHLTEDPDPDQPASRATVEVVAPSASQSSTSTVVPTADSSARLQFREVWWADSLGLPDIGQTISWAQVQWREQAGRLLIPIRGELGPDGAVGHESPASEGPALSTDRPAAQQDTNGKQLSPESHWLLHNLLRVYGFYQYIWKVVQWLLLTPAITVLLLVMGIVQVLAIVPFLGTAIITTSTAIINTVMLHWVAEIQVYLTDYTRSSAIRERFQHEVEDLLRDPLCDRVVVIAESGGTYIAYEGLTTLLVKPDLPLDEHGQPKPMTFICIASALHRIWLLANTDAERMHGALPKYVRWLHFWARYDPVATGPLTEKSLPPITEWDPSEENPYDDIRDSLRNCQNISVVNTDSTLTDHVSYWDNLEQVVGPIAAELVAGHPGLQQAVQGKLASPNAVLLRRWSVAWRYTLALAGGIAAGIGVLIWDSGHREFGQAITALVRSIDWGGIANSVCPACKAIVGSSVGSLPHNPSIEQLGQYTRAQAITYLVTKYLTLPSVLVVIVALLVMGLVDTLIARLAAMPTPFKFPNLDVPIAQRLGSIFVACAVGIGLVFVASLIFTNYVNHAISYLAVPTDQLVGTYVWALGLGELMYFLASVATLVAIIQQRQWGWGAGLLLALTPLTTFDPFYRTAVLAVAIVGCVVCLFRRFESGGFVAKVGLVLVALMCLDASIGTTLYDFTPLRTPLLGAGVYVEYLLPPLIFALWSGSAKSGGVAIRLSALRRAILAISLAYLALVNLLVIPYIVSGKAKNVYSNHNHISPSLVILGIGSSSTSTLMALGVLIALLIGVVMLMLCILDARIQHNWGWLIAIPLAFVGNIACLDAFSLLGVTSTLSQGGLLLSFALVATALIYALWVGQATWQPRRKLSDLQPLSVTVPAAVPVESTTQR